MKHHSIFFFAILISIVEAQDLDTATGIDLGNPEALESINPDIRIETEKLPSIPDGPKTAIDPKVTNPAAILSGPEDNHDRAIINALPKADAEKIGTALTEASNLIGGIRVIDAFEKLSIVDEILARHEKKLFTNYNLRGAAYTKIRSFDSAKAEFEKAVQLVPDSIMARFNLYEITFVTAKDQETSEAQIAMFTEAKKGFLALVDAYSAQAETFRAAMNRELGMRNEEMAKIYKSRMEGTQGTIKLLQFKIMICDLKCGEKDKATKIADSFNYMSDDPAYYLAKASFAYSEAENLKSRGGDSQMVRKFEEEASEWQKTASRVFKGNKQIVEVYLDSMVEVGWIEILQ